jgi:hypothetical protein
MPKWDFKHDLAVLLWDCVEVKCNLLNLIRFYNYVKNDMTITELIEVLEEIIEFLWDIDGVFEEYDAIAKGSWYAYSETAKLL